MELGIIEGFYGRPWSWEERAETVRFLAPYGYGFYLYAPKADPWLRRRWQEPHPEEAARGLAGLAEACRDAGVRFGVGLSPYEAWLGFDAAAKKALAAKLSFLDDLGVVDLAVLFDDMKGDLPDLAERQLEIVEFVRERSGADRLVLCPTYYSDDPVLDRVFGRRPDGYLERLGETLHPSVEIFWTGEEVISREVSPGHLRRVAGQLRRAPLLWDNYPVNDGGRMSRYLHVRAFTGRPAANADLLAAHGINAALQPVLTRVPALTLAESYERGPDYEYGAALRRAAAAVLGEELGRMLWEDQLDLQDVGLERLGEKEGPLRERWSGYDHPGAREVVAWLDGRYTVTDEELEAVETG